MRASIRITYLSDIPIRPFVYVYIYTRWRRFCARSCEHRRRSAERKSRLGRKIPWVLMRGTLFLDFFLCSFQVFWLRLYESKTIQYFESIV